MLGISDKGVVKNYQIIDVYDGTDLGTISVKESIEIYVNPTGITELPLKWGKCNFLSKRYNPNLHDGWF